MTDTPAERVAGYLRARKGLRQAAASIHGAETPTGKGDLLVADLESLLDEHRLYLIACRKIGAAARICQERIANDAEVAKAVAVAEGKLEPYVLHGRDSRAEGELISDIMTALTTETRPNKPPLGVETPLHQAWDNTLFCLWCGMALSCWPLSPICPGHKVGDPLPAYRP